MLILGVFCLLGGSVRSYGQNDFTRIVGTVDQSIPIPTSSPNAGQKDDAALQELAAYRAVSTGAGQWQGLHASGTMTDTSGTGSPAALTIVNGDRSRLDVDTANGQRSTRINGIVGRILEVDSKSFVIPPTTAKAGLFAYPRLLVPTFPDADVSVIDRGPIQIDGRTLHRITVEESILPSEIAADQRYMSAVDLYFDPSTHLLAESAVAVQLDFADLQRYLIVISYGDYRHVQGELVPYRYDQSLNGQHQWTLQLNDVDLQPTSNTSYFSF